MSLILSYGVWLGHSAPFTAIPRFHGTAEIYWPRWVSSLVGISEPTKGKSQSFWWLIDSGNINNILSIIISYQKCEVFTSRVFKASIYIPLCNQVNWWKVMFPLCVWSCFCLEFSQNANERREALLPAISLFLNYQVSPVNQQHRIHVKISFFKTTVCVQRTCWRHS